MSVQGGGTGVVMCMLRGCRTTPPIHYHCCSGTSPPSEARALVFRVVDIGLTDISTYFVCVVYTRGFAGGLNGPRSQTGVMPKILVAAAMDVVKDGGQT